MIVGAARTPVGSYRSAFASKSATSLGAIAIKGVLENASINLACISLLIQG